ncbi:MAG: hypothetical protein E6P95_03295 [Candidatus Moraniibacteriota bacterium]|nr:MAG: hypothetical protein E6P95_03295 [Candidatus Moranbacteria bacterium]
MLEHKHLTWIDFESPSSEDITYLNERFDIHPLVLEELITPSYQPRVLRYTNCLFFSLHVPLFDTKERTTYPGELDIIITKSHLITGHRHPIYQIDQFLQDLETKPVVRRDYFENTPAHTLYRLLQVLIESCFPKLKHISDKLDFIESQVFAGKEKEMVAEISVVKRDILNFRRTLKPQRSLLESIVSVEQPFIPNELRLYFQDLISTNIRIWNMLESSKETIEALEDTNNSLLSNKLNQTMKVLTIFSAVILPLTVYSNAMSMNTKHLPFENAAGGFWWHFTMMISISLLTIIIFRWRRWI